MSTRLVHRPARSVRPAPPGEPVEISSPPPLGRAHSGMAIGAMLPMVGAAVSMSMMMFMRGSAFAAVGAVVMVLSVLAAAAFFLTQRGQGARQRRESRQQFMAYLEGVRDELGAWERDALVAESRTRPGSDRLLDVINDPARRWERRRGDDDFLTVRVGTGRAPRRAVRVKKPDNPVTPPDAFLLAEANALVERFATTDGVALTLELDLAGHVSVVGEPEHVRQVGRVIALAVAAAHAPDDVALAVVADQDAAEQWQLVRWLPHALERTRVGAAGPRPHLVPDMPELTTLLREDLVDRLRRAAQAYRHGDRLAEALVSPRLLVIDDAVGRPSRDLDLPGDVTPAELGITVVHLVTDRLDEASATRARVSVDADTITIEQPGPDGPTTQTGTPEQMPASAALGLARRIAPLRLSTDSYDDGSGTPPAELTDLLGIDDPSGIDLQQQWAPRTERDFLRVPIGVTPNGRPLLLDLKEAAQLGMGPHGLCVGATGSGKSELLRTLVLSLTMTHPPEQVAFMLVDYKGGATFAGFRTLPHTAGLLTNLAADATLVERMYASLEGEVLRRQQVLADAGRLTDIVEYDLLRAQRAETGGEPLDPLPRLLVIIDEFGELLTAKPDFIELFLQIGRIGRSIGVHLLLSSQRLEEGRLRGLDTYLSYRLALRTLSEAESRSVIGRPDAHHLPPIPGTGFLQVDTSVFETFKAPYVSGPLEPDTDPGDTDDRPRIHRIPTHADTGETQHVAEPVDVTRRTTGPTLMSTLVEQITHTPTQPITPVQPVWLEPLPDEITLLAAADGVTDTPTGTRLAASLHTDGLALPIGLLDDPARQWQGPWLLDLDAGGGHVAIVGSAASGKSTALRTIALSAAASRTPVELAVYGIDLLGNGLRGLEALPHVGTVTGREQRETIRRLLEELTHDLVERERIFEQHRVDTLTQLRALRADGGATELAATDVILLLDGYGQLTQEHEHLEPLLHTLLARGGRHGIHVITTARRWSEIRAAQTPAFGQRIELALTDPSESGIDARTARTMPRTTPGRALTDTKLIAHTAWPSLAPTPRHDPTELANSVHAIARAWHGPTPPAVRVLPTDLPATNAPAQPATPGHITLGVRERDLTPVTCELLGRDQHLLVLGDNRTGKTNLLRLVMHTLTSQLDDHHLVFAVFDPRRELADATTDDLLGGHATHPAQAQQLAEAVAAKLLERQRMTPEQLADEPHIVAVIDDYDILTGGGTAPLQPLAPHIPAALQLKLHLVIARRVAGAARGLYDPVLGSVRESGCLALVFSGDRSEGILLPDLRATALPPGRAQAARPGAPIDRVQTIHLD